MTRLRPVVIVVPAYNEATVLAATLDDLQRLGHSIVVVDDGSTDGTGQCAGPGVVVLRHPINLGQGAALETGVRFALSGGAEYIVHFDADGQHSAASVPDLLAPLLAGEADVVLGSRFLRAEDARLVPPPIRCLLFAARRVNGLLTGVWLTDAHNGLRALNRRAARSISLRENGAAHATEILTQIRKLGLRCVERPTAIRYTRYSRSKGQPMWNSFNILLDLLAEWIFR